MKKAAKNTRKNLSEPRHPLDNMFPFVKTEQIFVSSSRYLRLKFGRLDKQIIHSNEREAIELALFAINALYIFPSMPQRAITTNQPSG